MNKKGIVYIMTTVVPGLIKIGKAGTDNYPERMRFLEANGYYNISGLKRFFAIEVDDYDEKEKHDCYSLRGERNEDSYTSEVNWILLFTFRKTLNFS